MSDAQQMRRPKRADTMDLMGRSENGVQSHQRTASNEISENGSEDMNSPGMAIGGDVFESLGPLSPGDDMDDDFDDDEDEDDDLNDAMTTSPSIPDEDIDFDLVYALHTFIATVEGQASVVKGDSLTLLDDSNSYWWLVRVLKTQEVGYIPAENIETPYERLARLNKHRNVDLSSATLEDHHHANALQSMRADPANMPPGGPKAVTFTAPTYVEHSGDDWDDEEEEYPEGMEYDDYEDGEELDEDDEEDEEGAGQDVDQRDQEQHADLQPQPVEERVVDPQRGPIDQRNIQDDAIQTVAAVGMQDSGPQALGGTEQDISPNRSSAVFRDNTIDTVKMSLTPAIARDDPRSLDQQQQPYRDRQIQTNDMQMQSAPQMQSQDRDPNRDRYQNNQIQDIRQQTSSPSQSPISPSFSVDSPGANKRLSSERESDEFGEPLSPADKSKKQKQKEKKEKKTSVFGNLFKKKSKKKDEEETEPALDRARSNSISTASNASDVSPVTATATGAAATAAAAATAVSASSTTNGPTPQRSASLQRPSPLEMEKIAAKYPSNRKAVPEPQQQQQQQQQLKQQPYQMQQQSYQQPLHQLQQAPQIRPPGISPPNRGPAPDRSPQPRPTSQQYGQLQPGAAPSGVLKSPRLLSGDYSNYSPTTDTPTLNVLRLFAGNVQSSATFKTVLLNSNTKTTELIKQALQRFRLGPTEHPEDYYLTVKELDGEEVKLEDIDHPLEIFQSMNSASTTPMPMPSVNRASIGSLSSIASTLSLNPAITRLGMNDFSDDSVVKFYLNKKESSRSGDSEAHSRFALKVFIHGPDLPAGMVFDSKSAAIIPRSPRSQTNDSEHREKIIISIKNATVAEVIEDALDRFGILEGVVMGGDEVEEKLANRRHSQRTQYGLSIFVNGVEKQLHPQDKVVDTYPTLPLFRTFEKRSSSEGYRRRSTDSAALMNAASDIRPEDPHFVLRRVGRKEEPAAAPEENDVQSRKEMIAAQRAASRANQKAILSAQKNKAQGVDVLLPDRTTLRSSRLMDPGSRVRYSFISREGEEYDISDIIEDVWRGDEDKTKPELKRMVSDHKSDDEDFVDAPESITDTQPLAISKRSPTGQPGEDVLGSLVQGGQTDQTLEERIEKVLKKVKAGGYNANSPGQMDGIASVLRAQRDPTSPASKEQTAVAAAAAAAAATAGAAGAAGATAAIGTAMTTAAPIATPVADMEASRSLSPKPVSPAKSPTKSPPKNAALSHIRGSSISSMTSLDKNRAAMGSAQSQASSTGRSIRINQDFGLKELMTIVHGSSGRSSSLARLGRRPRRGRLDDIFGEGIDDDDELDDILAGKKYRQSVYNPAFDDDQNPDEDSLLRLPGDDEVPAVRPEVLEAYKDHKSHLEDLDQQLDAVLLSAVKAF